MRNLMVFSPLFFFKDQEAKVSQVDKWENLSVYHYG